MDFSAFFYGILLIATLTADSFAVSFAYGMGRTKISFPMVIGMNLIMSLLLGAAMATGNRLAAFLPEEVTLYGGSALLLLVGLYRIRDFFKKRKSKKQEKEINKLTGIEAVVLAVVLSVDSLAVGLGTGLARTGGSLFLAGFFAGGILMMEAGWRSGYRLRTRFQRDFSWLSGICLIALAFVSLWKS